jgi:SAM-dependent methyltransferase
VVIQPLRESAALKGDAVLVCSVCGGSNFVDRAVIPDGLTAEWRLEPHERAYIDRQQGTLCTSCGCNLRSIALANAIRSVVGTDLTLIELVADPRSRSLKVLEINEAGHLSPILKALPGHVLATYPEVDMHATPYPTDSFDLVVHSDTLEHVSNPVTALAECRRVLHPNGALCFTVPTVVGRLTRSRAGLPNSYHGSQEAQSEDYIVHTEYGADMWTHVLQAGFSAVSIHSVDFPSALALSALK